MKPQQYTWIDGSSWKMCCIIWVIQSWHNNHQTLLTLCYNLPSQKEERVSELRNQLSERQALRSRRRASTITNQNHSPPHLAITQSDPRSLAPPPGYPVPTSDPHPIPPSFTNSSSLYQPDSKISRNNCHTSRLQLLYK